MQRRIRLSPLWGYLLDFLVLFSNVPVKNTEYYFCCIGISQQRKVAAYPSGVSFCWRPRSQSHCAEQYVPQCSAASHISPFASGRGEGRRIILSLQLKRLLNVKNRNLSLVIWCKRGVKQIYALPTELLPYSKKLHTDLFALKFAQKFLPWL